MVADAGASAVAVHGRTAEQSYAGSADWRLIVDVARSVRIPVFGSGDCVEPQQVMERMADGGVSGVLVGRGALRNPWIFSQARQLASGSPVQAPTYEDRARFLLEYIDLLLGERVNEAEGFRHTAVHQDTVPAGEPPARGRERWVINKLRALCSWYSKGLEDGSRLRVAVNNATSIQQLRDIIHEFFASSNREVARAR